jgi:tetratricopeptide (TPR) repeat protein
MRKKKPRNATKKVGFSDPWRGFEQSRSTLTFVLSLTIFSSALTIRTICFGENDESVAAVLQYMGTLEFRAGELDRALQLLSEFIRIRKNSQTEKDGDYVNVLFMMGNVHKMQGSEEEAQKCWTEAYEVFQGLGLVEDNPEIAELMGNLLKEHDDSRPERPHEHGNGKFKNMLGRLTEKMKGTFNEANKLGHGRSKNRGHQLLTKQIFLILIRNFNFKKKKKKKKNPMIVPCCTLR